MTDIKDMQPGREMDALIAEKVMGWHKVRLMCSGNRTDWEGFPPGVYGSIRVTKYSTTWEGMKLVVEEMKCRNFLFMLLTNEDGSAHAGFAENVKGKSKTYKVADRDEYPHAVAAAALYAILAMNGGEQNDPSGKS